MRTFWSNSNNESSFLFFVNFASSLDCLEPEKNPDFLKCEEIVDEIYKSCIVECRPNDFDCQASCNRVYNKYLNHCPCQAGQVQTWF